MTESFPSLPAYDHEAWNTSLRTLDRPDFQLLMMTYLPFAYFEIPLDPATRNVQSYIDLLQEFLASTDPRNRRPYPEYFDAYDSEGGISNIYLPDGFLLPSVKAFCYDAAVDGNWTSYTGIKLCNHSDMRSQVYGILKVAHAFAAWLAALDVPHKVFLRKIDAEDNVEVILN